MLVTSKRSTYFIGTVYELYDYGHMVLFVARCSHQRETQEFSNMPAAQAWYNLFN